MGMICNLLRVTNSELEGFLKDSSSLESVIYNEETDEENPNLTDIDKSWDGIIFLLTGESFSNVDHPLTKVLFSGQFIDEEQDLGYGPAHYLTPDQVADLNNQISKITVAELKLKYNPERMADLEVYPAVWKDEGDEAFEYLGESFISLQKVYSEATRNGEAIITFLN